jgi:uncharacterized membrane protein YdfJ with MMPL/SSD domain
LPRLAIAIPTLSLHTA